MLLREKEEGGREEGKKGGRRKEMKGGEGRGEQGGKRRARGTYSSLRRGLEDTDIKKMKV